MTRADEQQELNMQRRTTAVLTAALAAVLAFGLSAPAHADAPTYGPETSYVALGDSYSAGLGASGPVDTTCGRSPSGYPALWAEAHGITDFINATCSGAVASDLIDTQIASLSPDTDVVTLTIGGNDMGLGDQASACLVWAASCEGAVDDAKAAFPTTLAAVDAAFAGIRAAAPDAQVYVIGYPHLFEAQPFCFGLFVPVQSSRVLLNESVDNLNAALSVKATAAGFTYVDATSTFAGHGVCSSSSWINGVASLPGPLHPNTNGYKLGYLAALTAVTG
jgi:lysophospholipase L1-like esterase